MRDPSSPCEQPAAAIPAGDIIAMPPGPLWHCQLLPAPGVAGGSLSAAQRQQARALLQQLRPAGITLEQYSPHPAGELYHSRPDCSGRAQAYALLRPGQGVEMAAVLPTGCWPPHAHAWWPGSYEIPLLQQVATLLLPLAAVLALPAPFSLRMTLQALQGSALIAKSRQGSEQAYPLPPDMTHITLPAVRLDGFNTASKASLVQALDQVRIRAGAATATAFYL